MCSQVCSYQLAGLSKCVSARSETFCVCGSERWHQHQAITYHMSVFLVAPATPASLDSRNAKYRSVGSHARALTHLLGLMCLGPTHRRCLEEQVRNDGGVLPPPATHASFLCSYMYRSQRLCPCACRLRENLLFAHTAPIQVVMCWHTFHASQCIVAMFI
jgi:hypothetical protein